MFFVILVNYSIVVVLILKLILDIGSVINVFLRLLLVMLIYMVVMIILVIEVWSLVSVIFDVLGFFIELRGGLLRSSMEEMLDVL